MRELYPASYDPMSESIRRAYYSKMGIAGICSGRLSTAFCTPRAQHHMFEPGSCSVVTAVGDAIQQRHHGYSTSAGRFSADGCVPASNFRTVSGIDSRGPFLELRNRLSAASCGSSVRINRIKPDPSEARSESALRLIYDIARVEGIPALWKGFVARMYRVGPGAGVSLLVYECALRNLNTIRHGGMLDTAV